MSRVSMRLLVALFLLAPVALLTPAASAEHHEGGDATAGGMPPMGRPAQMDEVAYMIGDWNVLMEMQMAPDAPWTSIEGTAKTENILDGCVQRMTFDANMMGMEFSGIDHMTFNRMTGKFESIWVDNMSANFTKMTGSMKDGKLLLEGITTSTGVEVMARSVSEKRSDNEVYWEMSDSHDDGKTWTTTIKMTYTRAD